MIDDFRKETPQEGTQTLPDTQLVGSQGIDLSQTFNNGWGTLYPINRKCRLSVKVLSEKSYSVGRSPKCNITLTDNDMPNEISKISKFHFIVTKNVNQDGTHIVYLEDLSNNGTFINGIKVGKNRKNILTSTDEISLITSSFKVFIFIDTRRRYEQWLSAELAANFQVLRHLGTGGFGEVKLVINRATFHKYAIKKLENTNERKEIISNEVNILKRLKHPCIVNFETIYNTSDAVFITLEYVSGGNLMERLNRMTKLSEDECKMIFFQLILGVKYLHDEGIVHRDLKPENILLEMKGSALISVKLTDFGLSKILHSLTSLRSRCGTLKYVAPEVILISTVNYNNKVDIWSLGIILFLCLSGQHPFWNCGNEIELAKAIVKGDFVISQNRWQLISKHATDLVKQSLKVNPDERITSNSIIRHPWFQDNLLMSRMQELIEDKYLNYNEMS